MFRPQDSDDDISHLEWETVRVRLIKAGTLEKLVESLASDTGELESTYVNVFLATYRTFSTASQILALIAKRYADLNNPTVMEAVRLQHKKYSTHVNSSFWVFCEICDVSIKYSVLFPPPQDSAEYFACVAGCLSGRFPRPTRLPIAQPISAVLRATRQGQRTAFQSETPDGTLD